MSKLPLARSVACALALAAGCGSSGNELAVDLRTDLRPRFDFEAVRVRVTAGEREERRTRGNVPGDDFLDGERIAELDGLPSGETAIAVELIDRDGAVRAERTQRVRLQGDQLVTVVVTSDPDRPECEGDGDCSASAACTDAVCAEQVCFQVPDDGSCGAGEYCDVRGGCRSESTLDAGTPDAGTGCTEGEICDDGVFCNGTDRCAADGTCSVHDGDPCPGSSTCDESADTCTGCSGPSDCPDEITGPWSSCSYPTQCAQTGSKTRTVTRYTCEGGTCVPETDTDTGSCSRSTGGMACGTDSCGAWGDCTGFDGTCDRSGTEERDCETFECSDGSCQSAGTVTETRSCMRDTDGVACDDGVDCTRDRCMEGVCEGTRCGCLSDAECPPDDNCWQCQTDGTCKCVPLSIAESCAECF